MEMTFMEDMWQLMQASHFRLLSKDDWDTAQEEQFTVSSSKHVPSTPVLSAGLLYKPSSNAGKPCLRNVCTGH